MQTDTLEEERYNYLSAVARGAKPLQCFSVYRQQRMSHNADRAPLFPLIFEIASPSLQRGRHGAIIPSTIYIYIYIYIYICQNVTSIHSFYQADTLPAAGVHAHNITCISNFNACSRCTK